MTHATEELIAIAEHANRKGHVMTVTCTRHSLRPCLCPECSGAMKQPAPVQQPSGEPAFLEWVAEVYPNLICGTQRSHLREGFHAGWGARNPAPLSPDVAELVRRVRQVDYAEDATSFHKMTDEQLKELIANCKAAKEMK